MLKFTLCILLISFSCNRHPFVECNTSKLSTDCSVLCDCVGLPDCNCCKQHFRQNGEPCSAKNPCDRAKKLACYYKPELDHLKFSSPSNANFFPEVPKTTEDVNKQSQSVIKDQNNFFKQKVISLTLKPPNGKAYGTCWKVEGNPCFVNSKVIKHTSLDQQSCRYSCVCIDGIMICSDLCYEYEHRSKSSVLCQPIYDGRDQTVKHTVPKLLPNTSPQQCCKQWACLPSPTSFKTKFNTHNLAKCDVSMIGATSKWSACGRQCDVGVSVRTKIIGPNCRNITQVRLCFWRPCNDSDKQITQPAAGENICQPTVKSKTPGHILFALPNCKKGSSEYGKGKCVTCRTIRPYRPKFCTSCYENSCCWPIRVKIKKFTFICSDGTRIRHYFEWIQECKCVQQPCPNVWSKSK